MTAPRTPEDARYRPVPGDTWTDTRDGFVWTVIGYVENPRDICVRPSYGDAFNISVWFWALADHGAFTPVGGES